jgi:hypothetical protein
MKTADPARMYIVGDPRKVNCHSQSIKLSHPFPHGNSGPARM